MPDFLVYLALALAVAALVWTAARIFSNRRRRDAAGHRIDLFSRTADQ